MHMLRLNAADPADVDKAASILRSGGTVAFATETVYGLGANALDADAVAKIFVAKQRPAWDPLIVHVADNSMVEQVAATVPAAARVLMERFWPGPLTLLMPRHARLPAAVTAGRDKVGVRMPSHSVARSLIRAAGVPIAAPSANTFGHVSPTTAAHVAADLDGRIDAILDAGETAHGIESTVVDATTDPCILYRPGAITLEHLRVVWPAVEVYSEILGSQLHPAGLASPGLGMRHYAPRARLVLVEGDHIAGGMSEAINAALTEGRRVGVMLPKGMVLNETMQNVITHDWGAWHDPASLAHELFSALRALDSQGIEVIICPLPASDGIGAAIIDRLRKAARRA